MHLISAEKKIRCNNIGIFQHVFKCFFPLFLFFEKELPGILGVISIVSTCMCGTVAIFSLSITLAKRYCIAFQPDGFHICIDRSQTPQFSNEPKICHICVMLKVIPLKCIILNGILFLAKNYVGVCHIYLPSTNSSSGNSIVILQGEPWMASEILQHVSVGFHHMPGTSEPLFPHSPFPHHYRSRFTFFSIFAWLTQPTSKITDFTLTTIKFYIFKCIFLQQWLVSIFSIRI